MTSSARIKCLLVFIFLVLGITAECTDSPSKLPAKLPANWNDINLARIRAYSDVDSFSFAVVGDNRGGNNVFREILKDISRDPGILFVINLGDTVQSATERNYSYLFNVVNKYLTKPLLVVPGNHEVKGDSGIFRKVLGRCYYSFHVGSAAFIILSCTDTRGIDPKQKVWLKKELAKFQKLRHRLIFMHYPLFDPDKFFFSHAVSKKAALDLLTLFKKYRVTMIFAGHIHGFFEGVWDTIPFVVTGGGGAKLMGSDPDHYFFHYIRVSTINGNLTYKVCECPPSETFTKKTRRRLFAQHLFLEP